VIRLLLAEDQHMVRGALAALLALEPDLEVVAQVGSGDEVIAAARRSNPDVALLDIEMPGMDGFTAAEQLLAELPACKVLILTTFNRPGYVRRALAIGVAGFLAKDGPSEELAASVRRVHAGESVIDPAMAVSALREGESPLTPRERDVMLASIDGSSVVQIARRLRLTEGTTRNYLSAAMRKLDAPNRTVAAERALAKGWL
jgi:two-component system, NarL family, response regulator DesR